MKQKNIIQTAFVGFFFLAGIFLDAQVKIQLDDREDYVKRSTVFYQKSNWDAGKRIVDEGLKKYPKDSDLKMLSGRYFHEKKQYDRARYELQKSLEHDPNNIDAKQILVNVETNSKRYSSAICYVNELLEVNPYWRGLWNKKIDLYELQGNKTEANRLRKRLSQIYPEDKNLQNKFSAATEERVLSLKKAGNIDDAIVLQKELVQKNPGNESYYLSLINDYEKAGDKANALVHTERALNQFPGKLSFVNKKTGLLMAQKRFGELLPFLQEQMRRGNATELQRQYNYYLTEAARNARDQDPATLYGKVLDQNPGNQEAFVIVFNDAVANSQYEQAIYLLNRYRRVRGSSKELDLKELMVYSRTANQGKVTSLTKELFAKYPGDSDLRNSFASISFNEAKSYMVDQRWNDAISSLLLVIQYGDDELRTAAQASLFNSYYNSGDLNNALNVLNQRIERNPSYEELYVKRADIYFQLNRYDMALNAYETAISLSKGEHRNVYLGGYAEMMTQIIKPLNDDYRFEESLKFIDRWLLTDASNELALTYAVNVSNQINNKESVLSFAQRGREYFPDNTFFTLKVAQVESVDPDNFEKVLEELKWELAENPYHKDVINTYAEVSESYAKQLNTKKLHKKALTVLEEALHYSPRDKALLYRTGLTFEQLKQYDSAYQYQSKYEPSLPELSEHKQHLSYLKNKTYKNEIGLSYLRSRFGDNYIISSISTIDYTRFNGVNIYTGRFNYAGRELGKGVQVQGAWERQWDTETRTKLDAAWSNQFFPSIALNGSVYRQLPILTGIEAELGVGYRRLDDKKSLGNLVLGATKELDHWRFNLRFNNFLLEQNYLYNLSGNVRYYLSIPKNYITAVGSIGSSPDVERVDYQLYDGFSVLNTMVGLGYSHLIYQSISAGILGTINNYSVRNQLYRNLYNLYFNVNVAF